MYRTILYHFYKPTANKIINLKNLKSMKLQKGNLVYACYPTGKEIIEVESFSKHFINGLGISAIEPIPLTEDWLEKMGFIECDGRHGKYYKHTEAKLFRVWMSDLCTWGAGRKDENSIDREYNTHWIKLDLKYLHQLQNLYHALTNNELTIKL